MALPQLSEEQRAENLKKAAAARHARAELRESARASARDPLPLTS